MPAAIDKTTDSAKITAFLEEGFELIASGDRITLTRKDEVGFRGVEGLTVSGGKLHKSLHKLLNKGIVMTTALGSDGVGGLSWPRIEAPWREIKRLYEMPDDWARHRLDGPPVGQQLEAELLVLHRLQARLREPDQAFRRARIRVEAGNDLTAYMLPLGADASTPGGDTAVLFQVILWLGSLVGQLYKARYAQPRPHALDPTLEPFIPVPSYSSYPSNHAFQSFLIAEVFSRMVPEHPGAAAMFPAAWAVAVNREYAGLHLRSDTIAGKTLASDCAEVMVEVLRDHRTAVRAEWLGTPDEEDA